MRALPSILLLACIPAACSHEPAALRGELGDRVSSATGGGSTRATTARPEIPADAPLVVFLGDSITAGLHLAADEAFPAVLQRELFRTRHPFRLVNAGVSGDTSAGGLNRIDWLAKQSPAIVVVELGGNDGLRGQDLASIESNLRAIVRASKAAGARVLLLGVQLPSNYGAEYTSAFEAIYPRIASELDVAFVPRFMDRVGGHPELTLEDGLHPTARGHEMLAENIAPKLAELLDELRAARR